MAIEFHCDHCGHLVRTADENAGKRGKCPRCHQSVYIPTPREQIKPLGLAPVDEAVEREQQRLDEESRDVARRLRDEQQAPPETYQTNTGPENVGADLSLGGDMETLIVEYALAMAGGQLNEAEEYARTIRANPERAQETIDRISADELPPERLANIPRPVLMGFLKQLSH